MLERRNALLIVGLPGTNRHRLGTEIVSSADLNGAVIRHVCRFGDADDPHQFLAQILADLGSPVDLRDTDVPDTDVLGAIRNVIRADHAVTPTLLLEDATFAAPESLSALASLAVSRDLRIITALTPETVSLAPDLADVADRIDLTPLDADTITRLLKARFGGVPHDVLVGFLHERSQGGYASLCEVADLLADSGAITLVEGTIVLRPNLIEKTRMSIPERRRSHAAERIGGSPAVIDLIDLVSVIGEVELDEAIACTSAEAVGLAVGHGPLRQIDGVLSMVDPLEAEVVVAALTHRRALALWQDHAPRVQQSMLRQDSAIRSARWYLECGVKTPSRLARIAARDANQRGLYHRTVAYTAPANTAATALEIQHERAHALAQTGDRVALRGLFEQLEPGDIATGQLMAYMRWASRMVPADQVAHLRERTIGVERSAGERRQRSGAVSLAELHVQAFSQCRDEDIRHVRTLVFSGALSPVDHAMAHTVLAAFLRHAGRAAEAVHSARLAVAMLQAPDVDASAPEFDTTFETLFMSLISAQDLPAAAEVLRMYQAKGVRYGRPGRLGPILSGILELHLGRLQQGLASLELLRDDPVSHDVLRSHGWVEALTAQAMIGLGRVDEAESMLAESEAQPVAALRLSDLERRLTQAFVHDALADPDRALEILADVAAEARTHGLALVELDALGLAVLIDGPTRLRPLLEAVDGFVAPSGTTAMWQNFAPLASRFDFTGLIGLVDQLIAADEVTLASRFAQYILDSGRRATDLTAKDRERLDVLAHPHPANF